MNVCMYSKGLLAGIYTKGLLAVVIMNSETLVVLKLAKLMMRRKATGCPEHIFKAEPACRCSSTCLPS